MLSFISILLYILNSLIDRFCQIQKVPFYCKNIRVKFVKKSVHPIKFIQQRNNKNKPLLRNGTYYFNDITWYKSAFQFDK